ncbi:MarR family transcriptional regulator [Natranaerovirga hydrolytica]|uniref:MarR family transcriptional regulator n=1 Tax=Natranaerovirga hydrolytica TaxID=680378 RepID=A0A4R1MRN4_9FIRM|nr:MarR family transcriptional regulator [Natranaerovirga hydrolytica]TCK93229.1 MarR family transcriptional regulator [Natranaerovirga hydrolytica]
MPKEELLKLDNQICFPIYAVSRSITKLYRPLLQELNITYPQYLVLLVLWEVEVITLRDLGKKLYLDSGTLTPLLKRMEKMHLIKRERSVEDERVLFIKITEKGLGMKEKASKVPECLLKNIEVDINQLIRVKKEMDELLKKLNS